MLYFAILTLPLVIYLFASTNKNFKPCTHVILIKVQALKNMETENHVISTADLEALSQPLEDNFMRMCPSSAASLPSRWRTGMAN